MNSTMVLLQLAETTIKLWEPHRLSCHNWHRPPAPKSAESTPAPKPPAHHATTPHMTSTICFTAAADRQNWRHQLYGPPPLCNKAEDAEHFSSGTYKEFLTKINTATVKNTLASYSKNRLLQALDLEVNKAEKYLAQN